ncbi:non-ribosomal peptide synthetase [Streptomyces sp. H27-D2]|uniref:non-ribosomal peptide synthetase n=1 Tax=Streptomyces sp. H27-D2 TaxID=3046304 RepID=UPI002DBBDD07|nr:non-ribosomal peptide synthetase [Streptomyces sp. H27-D2]MEC4020332.1 non-ribosomal peptide synthetase [Streptomyces sp. H27-D2]
MTDLAPAPLTRPAPTSTPPRTTALTEAPLSIAHGGPVPPPPADGESVLDWYDSWVRRTPGAAAVRDGEHHWTYAELDTTARGVMGALGDRVRPGDIVGVCLDRSAALVAVAVALARLGAVYLPLGPRPGERRLATVTDSLRVTCLIGDPGLLPAAHRAAEHLPLPVPADGANAAPRTVAAFLPPAPDARRAPDGAFYAVLTSGSTGTPKAVAVAQHSLGVLLRWHQARTALGPADRHSLHVGVAFDPHLLELWAALTCGASLGVAPDAVRWDSGALTDWWREAGITVGVSSTPMVEPLLDRPWPKGLALRHLCVGGDRLRRRPGADVTATVHNVYGPAEATVIATAYAMSPTDGRPDRTTPAADQGEAGPPTLPAPADDAPPIGRPLAGSTVCVTDADGGIVARGEAGELWIGGASLALGYLDEELTARRFTAPPEGLDAPGVDRVYRTGDRVLMRADGELEFLGRLDDQIKVSGVRIEPAEVEAAFEHDPRVRRAVVAARRTPQGAVQLAAFVLAAPDAPPTVAELLDGVRGWLPEQAVPAVVRMVTGYPLDTNGKVDRAALLATLEQPAPDERAEGVAAVEDDEAAGASERLVLRLCRDLLAGPGIGLDDRFADVGGNSLAAARLLSAVQDACGVRLRAPEVLRQPDLRSVAALLDRRLAAAGTAA